MEKNPKNRIPQITDYVEVNVGLEEERNYNCGQKGTLVQTKPP